jgi:hypothetical protein
MIKRNFAGVIAGGAKEKKSNKSNFQLGLYFKSTGLIIDTSIQKC